MDSALSANGRVSAHLVSPGGERTCVMSGANTLLYRCSDSVAKIFAGVVSRLPKTIGFVWASDGTKMTSFNFSPGVRDNKKQSEIVGTGLAVHDIPIDQVRRFSASDGTKYEENVVTLSAQTVDNGVAEYIYGFLLKDAEGNVLAVKKIGSSPVKRAEGYAMAASWSVTFN